MQTETNPGKRYAINFLVVSFIVLFLDQTIKYALTAEILSYPTYENHNALFGLPFDGGIALILLAFILCYLMLERKTILASHENSYIIYAGLIFGGIMGNAIDRISKGFVLDYLTFADYFSFNISDLAILIGSVLFFLKIIGK